MSAPIRINIPADAMALQRFPREATGWALQGTWRPNETEQAAAWELLVELSTRIAVVPLRPDEGLIREAFSSLYKTFDRTRTTLARHGPALAKDRRGELSFAVIGAHLLNRVLRPVLVEWHPRLRAHEVQTGTASTPTAEAERDWPDHDDARALLSHLRDMLLHYASLLARACDAEEYLRVVLEGVAGSDRTN